METDDGSGRTGLLLEQPAEGHPRSSCSCPARHVEEIFNFRSLRHAPGTVRIVDSQTLRLFPTGTTFLPLARFWGDNLAGLLKVKLPAGIKKGQRFKIDVAADASRRSAHARRLSAQHPGREGASRSGKRSGARSSCSTSG